MADYQKDLDAMINENNSAAEPLPVDAMNVVLNEFNARMLAKIASANEQNGRMLARISDSLIDLVEILREKQ